MRAIAHEMRAGSGLWKTQVARLNPILAVMQESGLNWNKNSRTIGARMSLPILYDKVPGINTATYAKSPAGQVPTAWPQYLTIDGMTQATYDWVYTEIPWTLTPTEKVLMANGQMGDLEDGKLKAALVADAKALDDWLTGSGNATPVALLGLQYLLSTSNSPGGISQSTYDWWRANITTSVGNGGETNVQNLYDQIGGITNEKGNPVVPDLCLASGAVQGSSFSVYNEMRNFMTDKQRILNVKMKQEYGIVNFEYMDMLVVQNTKVASQLWMLSTNSFYWQGQVKPKFVSGRIPGSMTEEIVMSRFASFGCDMPCGNGALTGWTS